MLAYGTRWTLYGARTGKKLCTSENKEKVKDKYKDLPVTASPIFSDFRCVKSYLKPKTVEFITPSIGIWVSGE